MKTILHQGELLPLALIVIVHRKQPRESLVGVQTPTLNRYPRGIASPMPVHTINVAS